MAAEEATLAGADPPPVRDAVCTHAHALEGHARDAWSSQLTPGEGKGRSASARVTRARGFLPGCSWGKGQAAAVGSPAPAEHRPSAAHQPTAACVHARNEAA